MASLEPVQSKGVSRISRLVTRQRLIVAACLIVLAAIVLLSLHYLRPGPSADAQLQAIDAAHALPDEQNAGKDYTLLVLNGAGAFLDPQLLVQNFQALAQPWRSADLPEAAKWIEERRAIIDALLQGGRKPKCWFPLSESDGQSEKRLQVAWNGTLLLLQAANNDFAEGRAEAGMEKLLCVFQMAEHFRSQMNLSDHQIGLSIASEGLKYLNRLLVTQDCPQEWLAKFEAALPPSRDITEKERDQLHEIQRLILRKSLPFHERILSTFAVSMSFRQMKQTYSAYLSEARAARILLALRRHKDQTGAWPATLVEIQGQIPPEALIDPLTRKPFVYSATGDSLVLYNVGPNGIDEGGLLGDDYHFWPPGERWAGSVKY